MARAHQLERMCNYIYRLTHLLDMGEKLRGSVKVDTVNRFLRKAVPNNPILDIRQAEYPCSLCKDWSDLYIPALFA